MEEPEQEIPATTNINDDAEDESPTEPPPETEEEKATREFNEEISAVLGKLSTLPSSALEIEMPVVISDIRRTYTKLCRALQVPENSTFITRIYDDEMDFSYQCVGPVGIIPLTKCLISCKKVKILNFSYNKLGPKSLPAITSLIDQNENITHLNLSSNDFGKGCAKMLSELISKCFSVESLDLSNNDLGDEEFLDIGIALMKLDSVKELNLNTNDFSAAKAQPFGSLINKCSALLKLDLSCCHLEEGSATLFGGLKISNLTELNISRNGITNGAMAALSAGLRANKSLQILDISYNFIASKGVVTMAPGLKASSTLTVLNFAHNPVRGSAATVLLNSAGGNLKVLDLSGIKVNMAFFKVLRANAKAGKEVKVIFGAEIRYDFFPRELTAVPEDSLSKYNALSFLEGHAEEKGISLRNILKSIHANFITQQHEKLLEEEAAAEETEKKKKDDERSEMPVEALARELATGLLSVPKGIAQEIAELLGEEGFVNMWNLIARVRWKPDDLNVKIKVPKKPPAEKPKEKGKKK